MHNPNISYLVIVLQISYFDTAFLVSNRQTLLKVHSYTAAADVEFKKKGGRGMYNCPLWKK